MTIIFGVTGIFALFLVFMLISWRTVVPTNKVHVVQYSKKTLFYGKDFPAGSVYYDIPSFIPIFGISKAILRSDIFRVYIDSYDAYDKGKLPFVVDVVAFFRIADFQTASERITNFDNLHNDLSSIVKGCVRSILANSEIEEIMTGRSKFGDVFTEEVSRQIKNWGIESVKSIELMDVRDAKGETVIQNIMSKRKSQIEMESRQEVATSTKKAELSETLARKEVQLESQNSAREVSLNKIESEKQMQIALQEKLQLVSELEKISNEKRIEAERVITIKNAEIEKEKKLIEFDVEREQMIIDSRARKESQIISSEAHLESKKMEAMAVVESAKAQAEKISMEGAATADSEKLMQMAPVHAQISLAKEIGENSSYQEYLLTVRRIEANEEVGKAQFYALQEGLKNADVKIIANGSTAAEGLKGVSELVTSKGGIQLGAMMEGLSNTEIGKKLIEKLID